MIDVVILVDGVAEHPEVVDAGQEVDHAQGVITSLTQIVEQVFTSNLDPVLLDHEPEIFHFRAAVGEVDAVLLVVQDPFE